MSLVKSFELSTDAEFIARCPFPNCKSRIIHSSSLPDEPTIVTNSPTMIKLSKVSSDGIKERSFYEVADVWAFDNIGVSRKIPDSKENTIIGDKEINIQRLLVCSDCDRGPLGFAGFFKGVDEEKVENLVYYLHNDSVLYEVKN